MKNLKAYCARILLKFSHYRWKNNLLTATEEWFINRVFQYFYLKILNIFKNIYSPMRTAKNKQRNLGRQEILT